MGRRIIDVDVGFLVDMMKVGDGLPRFNMVHENPLPDDARCVGIEWPERYGSRVIARLVVESDEWFGDSRDPVHAPTFCSYQISPHEFVEFESRHG